jgi:hypothetical protein
MGQKRKIPNGRDANHLIYLHPLAAACLPGTYIMISMRIADSRCRVSERVAKDLVKHFRVWISPERIDIINNGILRKHAGKSICANDRSVQCVTAKKDDVLAYAR